MNNRIKDIRKYFKLSQTEFGSKIGVTIGVIRNLEQGKTQLESPLFELFCKTFNVNPDWLLTGNGDMFIQNNDSVIDNIKREYSLSDTAAQAITNFLNLSDAEQNALIETLKKIVK